MDEERNENEKTEGEDWSQPMNKYILVVVAAQEARRINEAARQAGREIKERITEIALQRVLDGKVKYVVEEDAS